MYSIIIPCYKSSETIRLVVESTIEEMNNMGRDDFEFVLVNDCSPDGGKTIAELKQLANDYPFVKVIDLAKNTGQHNAVMAGLREASGDVLISMDDDMQTRPSELHKMFEAFDNGFDVVYGAYPDKKESLFRLMGSWVNKFFATTFINKPKDLKSSSFWIIRKYVRDNIITYDGSHAYLLGLILRATSNITHVEVQHFEREVGSSGYNLKSLIALWSNIIGFTVKPMRIALRGGIIISILSILFAVAILLCKIFKPGLTAGWASTMVLISFSLGVQLFFSGLIGEYVGRTYLHVNRDPQYIIREKYNFEGDK